MFKRDQVPALLDQLVNCTAADLETQTLDFKEWKARSDSDSIDMIVEAAVCMANAEGGCLIIGIKDDCSGRENAILGIPWHIECDELKRAIHNKTDPRMTPEVEEIPVQEGTKRLLLITVVPTPGIQTDTQGKAKIRVGTDCQPMTGSVRVNKLLESGDGDYTAGLVPGSPMDHISDAAMEILRQSVRREQAPPELAEMDAVDLLGSLGLIRNGQLTRAGLLLVGKEEAIARFVPGYAWTYLRMKDDTDYVDRLDGPSALITGVTRLLERISADNPITTVKQGLFHFEYRAYPEIALREVLMNAFCHADLRCGSPIIVKHSPAKIEIGNPGGFIGGITPENILHHPPTPRNPLLVDALTRLRLTNRSNLGIPRIYKEMLVEGKEPPHIEERGHSVVVTLMEGEFSPSVRAFVEREGNEGRALSLDHLLILNYLNKHPEMKTTTASALIQRSERETLDILHEMQNARDYIERGGTGKGTYWRLCSSVHRKIKASGHPDRSRRIETEAAKTLIVSVLKQRMDGKDPFIRNEELREITQLDRYHIKEIMAELRQEVPEITLTGKGRGSKYHYRK
jgi:ATP-dependent DNA helicase RecG